MSLHTWNSTILLTAVMGATGLLLSGCGQSDATSSAPPVEPANASVDDHSGWWCPEHGVPEEICAQCDSKLAVEFQKKGDWCEEHNRPDSQCFICHPELEAKFAAQYEAKYGKKPPEPSGEHSDHEGHEHDDHAHES